MSSDTYCLGHHAQVGRAVLPRVPGKATPPPLHLKSPTLTLLCRDFPRDGRDPGAHVLPRLSVTIEQGHIPHVPQASVWGLPSHFFLWLVGGVSGIDAFMPFNRLNFKYAEVGPPDGSR